MIWDTVKNVGKKVWNDAVRITVIASASKGMKYVPNYLGVNLYNLKDNYYLDILEEYSNKEINLDKVGVKIKTKSSPKLQKNRFRNINRKRKIQTKSNTFRK